MLPTVFPKMQLQAQREGEEPKQWVEHFLSLSEKLSLNVGASDATPEGNL
jgi:hypothetical protein